LSAELLTNALADALDEHLAALLGMARKSSQAVSGGNQVYDALDRPEKLAVVILAEDISAGVVEKIERKARVHGVPCFRFSTKADLGQLLGRGERSVTALTKGRLAEAFLAEWQKTKKISGEC
jgi:ribosomal protein L7Ae-like RNA K-turn-binding protein